MSSSPTERCALACLKPHSQLRGYGNTLSRLIAPALSDGRLLCRVCQFTAWCDRGADSSVLWHQHGAPVYFCRPDDATVSPVHVQVQNGNFGAIKFVNCEFQGQPTSIAVIGAGELAAGANRFGLANGTVSFIGCHFEDCES